LFWAKAINHQRFLGEFSAIVKAYLDLVANDGVYKIVEFIAIDIDGDTGLYLFLGIFKGDLKSINIFYYLLEVNKRLLCIPKGLPC
jgi:hypothetical protein